MDFGKIDFKEGEERKKGHLIVSFDEESEKQTKKTYGEGGSLLSSDE